MRRPAIDMPNGKKLSPTFLVLMLLLVFIGPTLVWESASRVQLMTTKSPLLEIPHTENPRFHLVISTGCNDYQDWQSYLFFYSVWRTGQVCNVTRVASGCSDEAAVQQRHKQYIQSSMSSNFQLHLTPDYSKMKPNVDYVYFNKAMGVRHWMEHVLGYPKDPVDDDVILVLMDPDQLVLRNFTNDYSDIDMRWMDNKGPKRVQHGTTLAQLYGFRHQFVKRVNWTQHGLGESSPLHGLKHPHWYAAGPPYLATARDFYQIVTLWSEFKLWVYDDYPHLLAEMFAYCLAAVHAGLKPTTARGFMVSDVTARGSEGWYWMEDSTTTANLTHCSSTSGGHPSSPTKPNHQGPFVLHCCQIYQWGSNSFYKYRVPKEFVLSCKANPIVLANLTAPMDNDDGKPLIIQQRNAWIFCTLIPTINEALQYFQHQHCSDDELAVST
jgi:hypothetical protein